MERGATNEAEKVEKVAKEAKAENDEAEDYEDEIAMESFGEESHYEAPTVVSCLPSPTVEDHSLATDSRVGSSSPPPPSSSPSSSSYGSDGRDSYNERRDRVMRMKWLTVTGKKPLNMPPVKTYVPEGQETFRQTSFFGDRRPAELEMKRRENWLKLLSSQQMSGMYRNEGRVLREIRFADTLRGIRCLRFSPRFNTMAVSFGNGLVQIRRADTGEFSLALDAVETSYKLEVLAIRYHPREGSKVYIGGATGMVQVFDTARPKCIGSVRQRNNEICNIDLSRDGSILISVGKDGYIYIYDSHNLRLLSLQKKPPLDEYSSSDHSLYYHKMRIFGLRCHPTDPNVFVTGGWDCTVKVWDTRVCGAVNSIQGPRICGDAIDVRENEILTGSWTASNSLKIWDLSSGRVVRSVTVKNRSSPIEGEFIYVTKFFPTSHEKNTIVAGGNGSDEVAVINTDNNMALASFPAFKSVTALDSHSDIIAYGGTESLLRFGGIRKRPQSGPGPK